MAEVWALDTNVYIGALRDRDRLARLKRFLIRAGTRLRVSGVVALELRAGARTAAQEAAVNDLIAAYVTRDRGFAPSLSAYVEGGRVLAALGAREGVDVARAGSLVNDVLIATSCRELRSLPKRSRSPWRRRYGPSLGVATSGTCTWMSRQTNSGGSMPKPTARERT